MQYKFTITVKTGKRTELDVDWQLAYNNNRTLIFKGKDRGLDYREFSEYLAKSVFKFLKTFVSQELIFSEFIKKPYDA